MAAHSDTTRAEAINDGIEAGAVNAGSCVMVADDTDAVEIIAGNTPGGERILTAQAIEFLVTLQRRFGSRRRMLLSAREERQARFDAGELPDFLPETASIRAGDWRVAAIPSPLLDRRTEITGPVDRKMIINALNSGAKVFMADFEDSTSPTFANLIDGQINLGDAIAGTISLRTPEGKEYALKSDPAILMVRPRGWHLPEKHLIVDGEPMSGSLFDFGLYVFHNARALHAQGRGPYFYLPKLQSHREAALWEEVINYSERSLGLPTGVMKVTVLIETLPAVFEMDEILWALRSRIIGLNCGRWDYIFSYIKTFRRHADRVLPERAQVGMTVPFLKAYSELLIRTCHHRCAFAMGGMAAQIPINDDATANDTAMACVRADKQREARAGHDGTWVAHPALIPIAQAEFDAVMSERDAGGTNQLNVLRDDVVADRDTLIAASTGTISRDGFINNIDVCVRYLAAWLGGLGCVPIHHLMEDAATAEISRTQLWQWLHRAELVGGGALALAEGAAIDFALFDELLATCKRRLPDAGLPGQEKLDDAIALLGELTHADTLADFLTLPAYEQLHYGFGLQTVGARHARDREFHYSRETSHTRSRPWATPTKHGPDQ